MPIYEYHCRKCLTKFELRTQFGEDGSGFCPKCGGEARRLFSPVPIIFKGSGFYVTDNKKNHNGHPPDEVKADKLERNKNKKEITLYEIMCKENLLSSLPQIS
jgi:putative FmdB family regulatory protein